MNISYTSNGGVTANSKSKNLTLNSEVKIGEYKVPGAGEFDIEGIACEAVYLKDGLAYFIRMDDLTITYLTQPDASIKDTDDASDTDILVMDVRSDSTADTVKPIIKSVEPSYVFLIGSGATPQLISDLGIQIYDAGSTLKVTKSSLPEEGTWLVSAAN